MFEQVLAMLQQIVDDRTVPRNIRTKCEESINALKSESQELSIRLNTVISSMDEIVNDPNIPSYTRTQVWNIVSMLEREKQ